MNMLQKRGPRRLGTPRSRLGLKDDRQSKSYFQEDLSNGKRSPHAEAAISKEDARLSGQ